MNPLSLDAAAQAEANRRWAARSAERARKTSAAARGEWRHVETPERIATRLGMRKGAAALAKVLANPGGNVLESIIDSLDFESASVLWRPYQRIKTVCRMQIGGARPGLATGFLVGPRLLLTNHHVLPAAEVAAASNAQFDYIKDSLTGEEMVPSVFQLRPEDFFVADRTLDFALVAVEPVNGQGHPLAARGWNRLQPDSGKALFSEPVMVLQHPRGRFMETVRRNNKVVDVAEDQPFIYYSADTEPGSSGSPVYNSDWDVAALHHAGVGASSADGPEGNEGIRISVIMKWLDGWSAGPSSGLSAAQMNLLAGLKQLPPFLFAGGEETAARMMVSPDSGKGVKVWCRGEFLLQGSGTVSATIEESSGYTAAGGSSLTASPPPGSPADRAAQDVIARARKLLEDVADKPYYDEPADKTARDAYYPNTPAGATKQKRYDTLSALLNTTHVRKPSYSTARKTHLYPWVDVHEDGERRVLHSIYSGEELDQEELLISDIRREAELLGPAYFSMPDAEVEKQLERLETENQFNCEHVVPQSWFNKQMPMVGDLHHLFTCETNCNSFRGNTPYFQFTEEVTRDKCGRRENGTGNYHKFEPAAGKGAVARATLYFLLRYPGVIGNEARELQSDRLNVLLKWHRDEKPDRWEKHRNAAIFAIQGNRNPLIDFPDLADQIDFSKGFGT